MKLFNIVGTKVKVLGIGAALTGSLFCMSPITAFAGGLECTCETKCTEDCIDTDCPLCQEDYHNCEGEETELAEEEWGPLTPDGNMSIVDDYGSLEAGGKQFITVVTKNGNYFYIIIDRDDEGDETVHFLNMVDESDLLSLMDEDQVKDYIALTGDSSAEVTEDKTPTVTTPDDTETEETEEPVEVPEKKSKVNGIMALILIIALCGAGGYMYFTTTKHSKKKPKEKDPDEGYMDEPINLPTEEADFDVDASEGDDTESAAETAESEAVLMKGDKVVEV
ncbi:MAG: DUF4366 domain-containing protein [Butyrivibrio sp.]|nr:DUF4366 domain-containing protein [Butyrivibrio sp.]